MLIDVNVTHNFLVYGSKVLVRLMAEFELDSEHAERELCQIASSLFLLSLDLDRWL